MTHKKLKKWNRKNILGIAGIFVFSLVLGGLIWRLSYKPHSDVARTPTSSGSICAGVVTDSESRELLTSLEQLNSNYLQGQSTQENLLTDLEGLFTQLNPDGDTKKAGILKALVALSNDKIISEHVSRLSFRAAIAGTPPSPQDRQLLRELGVEDPEEYIFDNVQRTRPYAKALLEHGATLDDDGWNLSGLKLNALKLKEQPAMYTALAVLFSPEIASGLLDPERREALVYNSWVFLPPVKDPGEINPNLAIISRERPKPEDIGQINLQTLDTYHRGVISDAKLFHDYLTQYLLESEQSTSMRKVYTEIVASTWGFRKSKSVVAERQRAHRVTLEAAREVFVQLSVDWGVPEWHRQALLEAYNFALDKDHMSYDVKLEKGKLIFKATAAAIVLPVVIYYSPAVLGFFKPALAAGASVGALKMAAIPLVLGAGLATYNATQYSLRYGGDWFCHFAEEMIEKGVGALYMAPFMAAIPMATMGASAGVFASGHAAFGLSASAAPLIYTGVNVGVALYFIEEMVRHGIFDSGSKCWQKLARAYFLATGEEPGIAGTLKTYVVDPQNIQEQASDEDINVLVTEARALCAQGGADLAFAATGGAAIARGGIRAYQARRGEAPRVSGGQSAPTTSTTVEPARIALAEKVLARSLSESQKEAVQRAHEAQTFREKVRILKEAGINSVAERRELFKAYVVGEAAAGAYPRTSLLGRLEAHLVDATRANQLKAEIDKLNVEHSRLNTERLNTSPLRLIKRYRLANRMQENRQRKAPLYQEFESLSSTRQEASTGRSDMQIWIEGELQKPDSPISKVFQKLLQKSPTTDPSLHGFFSEDLTHPTIGFKISIGDKKFFIEDLIYFGRTSVRFNYKGSEYRIGICGNKILLYEKGRDPTVPDDANPALSYPYRHRYRHMPRTDFERMEQEIGSDQARPHSEESQGAGPQQEPRAVAENAPDMRLRQRVRQNTFQKSRDLLEYAKTFGPRFLSHLARLRGSDHWIDSGAGLAVATRFYAELKPGLTEETFFVTKYSGQIPGEGFQPSANPKTPIPQETFSNFQQIETLDASGRARVTVISYDMPPELVADMSRSLPNTRVLTGRFFEDIPPEEIRGTYGPASIITDVFGVFTYTENVGLVLQRYLDLLAPDGAIYIGPKKTFIRTDILQPNGESVSLRSWLESIPGLSITSYSQGTVNSGIEIRMTTPGSAVHIPQLKLVRSNVSSTDVIGPTRTFQVIPD